MAEKFEDERKAADAVVSTLAANMAKKGGETTHAVHLEKHSRDTKIALTQSYRNAAGERRTFTLDYAKLAMAPGMLGGLESKKDDKGDFPNGDKLTTLSKEFMKKVYDRATAAKEDGTDGNYQGDLQAIFADEYNKLHTKYNDEKGKSPKIPADFQIPEKSPKLTDPAYALGNAVALIPDLKKNIDKQIFTDFRDELAKPANAALLPALQNAKTEDEAKKALKATLDKLPDVKKALEAKGFKLAAAEERFDGIKAALASAGVGSPAEARPTYLDNTGPESSATAPQGPKILAM